MADFKVEVSDAEEHILRIVLMLMRRERADIAFNAANFTITADDGGCAITYQDLEEPSETFAGQGSTLAEAWAVSQNKGSEREALQAYLESSRQLYRH